MSVVENENRISRFTSSQIFRLMGIGKREMTLEELSVHKAENPKSKAKLIECENTPDSKFYTYVNEKFDEWLIGVSLDSDAYAASAEWGKAIEGFVHKLYGVKYKLTSDETNVHKDYPFWSGSKDMISRDGKTVLDIKCFYKKAFCELAKVLIKQDVQLFKETYPEIYYQLISNAEINGCESAEIVLFIPYKSQSGEIFEYVMNEYETDELWRVRFITEAIEQKKLYRLPFISDDSKLPNLVSLKFDIPETEFKRVRSRVVMAENEKQRLINEFKPLNQ